MGAPHIFINGSDLMNPFHWVAVMDTMGIIHWELEVGSYIPGVGGFATGIDGFLYMIEGNSEEAKAKLIELPIGLIGAKVEAKVIEKTGAKVEAKLLKGSSKAWTKVEYATLKEIGVTAENSGIRVLKGTADDAQEFFRAQVDPSTIREVKQGVFVGKDANGITFTYRASSKSGPPTIDINGVDGIRKIKFLEDGE